MKLKGFVKKEKKKKIQEIDEKKIMEREKEKYRKKRDQWKKQEDGKDDENREE